MADITENISGAGQSNSASQTNDEKLVTSCGKPVRRIPPTVEEALDRELSAAAALLHLAVEWRAACQSKVDSSAELSAISEMPEFRRYRKGIADFVAIVRRTDVGRVAVQQKS